MEGQSETLLFDEHYDVIVVQDAEKLIASVAEVGTTVKYYVNDEDLFQILYSTHIKISNSGRD